MRRQGLGKSLLLLLAFAAAGVLLIAPQAGAILVTSAPPDAITPSTANEDLAPG